MFDRSFLPEAQLQFVVMADTHYMLDPGEQHIEFESRRRQSARSAHALRLVASLEPSFVVHLGDLIQEFPESEGFEQSLGEALAQIADAGVRPRHVAGNHDVGDKPDPTVPTDWVTAATLAAYHSRFGRSWYSWSEAGCHFIVLNSQIMNGDLPEAEEQQRWLEADLAAHAGAPTYVFLHLSPFLCSETEPALGHYDNIDEPARGWLLELLRRYDVRLLFSGHTHFAFFNRVGAARTYVVPSTSFTRPGFGELFSSCPPPERGRDDTAKLGFFLVRVREDGPRVHLIRTDGATELPEPANGERRVITRTSADLERSPLGITLRHALAPSTEVPIAWQSAIRQPIRNDYPHLACVELGVRHARVPASDLRNLAQRERLAVLREEGVQITATWIWSERSGLVDEVACHRDVLDGIEIQLASRLEPGPACQQAIRRCATELALPVTLSPLLPREVVPGKQHARSRVGFHLDEVVGLDRFLDEAGINVDRVLCRVDAVRSPWEAMREADTLPTLARIGALDWAMEFGGAGENEQVARAAEAMVAAAPSGTSRLFLEPLVDLDRTMDVPLGLLDRHCNPRPVFHVVRTLNTILHGTQGGWTPVGSPVVPGAVTMAVDSPQQRILLVLPEPTEVNLSSYGFQAYVPDAQAARLVRLEAGTICPLGDALRDSSAPQGASAVIFERSDTPAEPRRGTSTFDLELDEASQCP